MSRRIAFVVTHPIQYLSPWLRELATRPGIDMEVLYERDRADLGFGVPVEWGVPLLHGYSSRVAGNISEEIAKGNYDSVVVSGWHSRYYWRAIRAARACGTRVMVRSDSHLNEPRSPLTRLAKRLPYRLLIPRFDACLAAGVWSREYFLHYGARAERVFIVPHTAEVACPSLTLRGGSDLTFLFAGKFIDRKRPLDFVRAIGMAAKESPQVRGLMAGDGPLRAEAETLARNIGVPVRFAGFLDQSQIGAAYAESDALVLPAASDSWGLVVNEAMSCGRCCIVSDAVGCGPDLVIPGETGYIFPMGDVNELSGLKSGMAGAREKAAAMGRAALQLIQHHSPRASADRFIEALDATA